MAERAFAHHYNMVDLGPRYDVLACVHTEPPATVLVRSDTEDVVVKLFVDSDPHERPLADPSHTFDSVMKRPEDDGGYREPLSEESVIFYAQGAINAVIDSPNRVR
jgi:hypothetical protein